MGVPADKAASIFDAVVELASVSERAAYLDAACGQDEQLRAEVEGLLQHDRAAGSFLHLSASVSSGMGVGDAEAILAPEMIELPGMTIGPYKLLEKIGEGGFGAVFMAEQQQPIRRKVALKVLKPGMDSRQVIARFEAERQALALMDHSNIAKVLDAGQTPNGRPFFVMDLVKGLPITEYCDQNEFTTRERLELFVSVCQAVQHAHQKGIIHRDLKPSNVHVTLNDGTPLVKVIDFGIAKAVGRPLTDKTLFTGFAQLIGTPLYMSPEQAALSNVDVDTRSDIYSLGVLLYELLTGTTPFEKDRLQEADYDQIRRIIREEEPPRPSTRMSTLGQAATTVSTHRKSDPKRLSQLFRGELDWIVMKALEKDRNRRYDSASALAVDVRRHLRDEPVEARPPSLAYKLRKFARRNRLVVAVAAWVFFTVFLAVGAWLWVGHLEDAHATVEAERRLRIERNVEAAWQEAVALREQSRLPGRDPAQALADLTAALAAVRRGEILFAGSSPPASLRQRLSELATELAGENKDRRMVGRMEEIRMIEGEPNVEGPESSRAKAFRLYGEAFKDYGIDVLSLDIEDAGQQIRKRAIRAQLVAILDNCWVWLSPDNKTRRRLRLIADEADPDPEGLTYRMRQALVRNDTGTLRTLARTARVDQLPPTTLADLGTALFLRNSPNDAVQLLRRSQLRYPDNFWVNRQLAHALLAVQPPQEMEALQFFYASLALRPWNARTWMDIGNLLQKLNRLRDAEAALIQAIACKPNYAWAHRSLGIVRYAANDLEGAIDAFQQALLHEPADALTHNNLGTALHARERYDEAIACFQEAIRLNPGLANAHSNLGAALQEMRRFDEAITSCREALRLNPKSADTHLHLGHALWAKGRLDEVIASFREATALRTDYPLAHNNLGSALLARGRLDEAIASFRAAIRLQPDYPEALANLGLALSTKGCSQEAMLTYQKAVVCFEKAIRQNPRNAKALSGLAKLLSTCAEMKLRDPSRAIALAKDAVALAPRNGDCRQGLGVAHYRNGEWQAALNALHEAETLSVVRNCPTWFFLAMAHGQVGDIDTARKWYNQAVAWMKENEPDDESLRRLQKETAAVLQIGPQPGPNEK